MTIETGLTNGQRRITNVTYQIHPQDIASRDIPIIYLRGGHFVALTVPNDDELNQSIPPNEAANGTDQLIPPNKDSTSVVKVKVENKKTEAETTNQPAVQRRPSARLASSTSKGR